MTQTTDAEPGRESTLSRMVDMRVPLWQLVTTMGGIAWVLISMYFTTNETARNVTELQITVKAGNSQVTSLAGEQALLRFRQENIESDIRQLKALQAGQVAAPVYQPPLPRKAP